MTTTETTLFTHPDWPVWFARMQSPEKWDRTDALVFADWCDERDEPAVAEYVRVAVELDAIPPMPETTNGPVTAQRLKEFQDLQAWRERYGRADGRCRIRLANLESDNPAWSRLPCPECDPEFTQEVIDRAVQSVIDGTATYQTYTRPRNCHVCNGTGNRLNGYTLTRWPYTPFVRGVGLRMEEIAEQRLIEPRDYRPTPLALALVAGLPTLRRLRVMDREPAEHERHWIWCCELASGPAHDPHELSAFLYLPLKGYARRENEGGSSPWRDSKYYPTPDAAHDALADGVWQWVAMFKPKEGE